MNVVHAIGESLGMLPNHIRGPISSRSRGCVEASSWTVRGPLLRGRCRLPMLGLVGQVARTMPDTPAEAPNDTGALPDAGLSRTRRGSLVRRIALSALSITMVLWVTVLTIGYVRERSVLGKEASTKIEAVAEVQKARLEAYVEGIERSVVLVASRTRFRALLDELATSPDAGLVEEMGMILSDAVVADDRLARIEAFDAQGALVVSTGEGSSFAVGNAEFMERAREEIVSGLIVRDESGSLFHVAAGPIVLGDRLIGVAMVVETAAPLLELVSDYTGLGDTGETVLAQGTSGDGAVFLTPLRFDPDAALRRSVAENAATATLVAVRGEEVVLTDAVDYRGEPVFAATRFLASAGWGLIVKVDASEVFAPLDEYLLGAVFALVMVTLAAGLGSWIVTRPIAERIRNVSEASAAIAAGDWSRKVPDDRNDELGDLAENFNTMTRKLLELTNRLADTNLAVEERNRQLEDVAEQLRRSNRELQEFAFVASHDLQEPLRKIRAFSDRLTARLGEGLDDKSADYLGRMVDAAERMQTLINDLLAFSRLTSRAQPFQSVDLTQVVREVVYDLEVLLAEAKGRVEVGVLPMVDAEPVQMRQLFQNLIGNAVKYRHPERMPVVAVSAEIGQVNGSVKIRVEDNGIGFDPDQSERIFQLFQRLHGRGEYEGTGMGLAISRRIAERHGGTLAAVGDPEKGSTFLLTLPIHQRTGEDRT